MKRLIGRRYIPRWTDCKDVAHGLAGGVWDNLGNGWRLECLCGFTTTAAKSLEAAGTEMDEHFRGKDSRNGAKEPKS